VQRLGIEGCEGVDEVVARSLPCGPRMATLRVETLQVETLGTWVEMRVEMLRNSRMKLETVDFWTLFLLLNVPKPFS